MNLKKEELIFYKHLTESADSAYYNEIRVYTDFLNLHEISIFHEALKIMPDISYSFWGGTKNTERVQICFHGDIPSHKNEIKDIHIIQPKLFPISCIYLKPLDYKFAETLSHRDYLGAVLGIGILRNRIGDIIIKDKDAYLFCDAQMEDFIANELVKIRHTNIKASIISPEEVMIEMKYETIQGAVSSIRLDLIVKTAFNLSRTAVHPYIHSGKVLVNGKENYSNSYVVKEGDIISVRGFGKLMYEGQYGVTKKGKINIKILKYI